jgi:hypothetical protein
VENQAIQGQTVDYDWIRLRLGGQGPGQSIRMTEWIDLWTTRFSGRFGDISWILRIRLSLQVVFGCCLCFAYCLCLYAGLTYSIVLTIVHFDGTSILSLHTINQKSDYAKILLYISYNHLIKSKLINAYS